MKSLNKYPALAALVWSGLWLTLSEVVRYFAFVMPETRERFSMVPDVAPMSVAVFGWWSLWMLLLTSSVVYAYWLHAKVMGHTYKTVFISATFCWVLFFVLFWFGSINMGLAHISTATVALPWAWVELLLTCLIAQHFLKSRG
jgi:phosphoglycerol transferase MdoB-like AlkP superfamily enzyme